MNKILYYKLLSLLLVITTIYLFSPHPAQAKGVVSVVANILPYIVGAVVGIVVAVATAGFGIGIGIAAGLAIGAGAGLVTVGVLDYYTCWIDVLWKGCANGGGGGGTSALQVDVRVNGSDGPVTFGAPATFNVEWSSVASKSCTAIGNWSGDIPGRQGTSKIENLGAGNYSYGVQCLDEANNSASDSVIVNVVGIPTIDFRAPSPVELPEPVKLFWATENADSCNASGDWSGPKQAGPLPYKTEEISKPRGNYTFTLGCTGPGGSNSDIKNVSVIQVPRCSFIANPPTIILPASSTLSWSCQYADSCSINQSIGSVNKVSGTKDVRPPQTTTYTLTCSGLDDSRSYQATVNVGFEPTRREVPPR